MTRAEITGELEARSIPKHIAQEKYVAWRGGNIVAIFGGLVVLFSFALVGLAVVFLREMPGWWFMSFALVCGVGGLIFVYLGAHAASGEAMDAAGKAGSTLAGAIAKAAARIRGINGSNGG